MSAALHEEPAIAKEQAKTKGTAKSDELTRQSSFPRPKNAYMLFMKDKKAAIRGELLLCLCQSAAIAGND